MLGSPELKASRRDRQYIQIIIATIASIEVEINRIDLFNFFLLSYIKKIADPMNVERAPEVSVITKGNAYQTPCSSGLGNRDVRAYAKKSVMMVSRIL